MNASQLSLAELYETDFNLWLEKTIQLLETRQFQHLDLGHLIEEIEGLGKRDKRELQSRLTTLFEHALKRTYVISPRDYRSWEETIVREQRELYILLKNSPSLKRFWEEIIRDCYEDALKFLKKLPDYRNHPFPESCPFPTEPEQLLNKSFWEE